MPVEENLASSIIDIRLIDQQKQNLTLNETINQLQNELAAIQAHAFRIYSSFVGKKENDSAESPSIEKILADISEKCSQMNETNENLSKSIEKQNVEITMFKEEKTRFENELAENTTTIDALQKSIDSLIEKLALIENANEDLLGARQGILVELEMTKSSLAKCETQRTELNASLDSLKEELEKVLSERRTEWSRHADEICKREKEVIILGMSQDKLIQEKETLQSQLNHIHQELEQANNALVAKSNEHLTISSKLDESEKKLIALQSIKENLEYDVGLHETETSKLNKQLEKLTNEIENQNHLVAQLKSEREQFEKDINELKAVCSCKMCISYWMRRGAHEYFSFFLKYTGNPSQRRNQ